MATYIYNCKKCGSFIGGGSTGCYDANGRIVEGPDKKKYIINTMICGSCIEIKPKPKQIFSEMDPYGEENWEE